MFLSTLERVNSLFSNTSLFPRKGDMCCVHKIGMKKRGCGKAVAKRRGWWRRVIERLQVGAIWIGAMQ